MAIRKTLTSIVLAGVALALGLNGCSKHDDNSFKSNFYNDKIGEEQVSFYSEYGRIFYSVLEVTRSDSTVIKYFDLNYDLKLEYIDIKKDGQTIRYGPDLTGQKVIEQAQSQFDEYLAKIYELDKTKGLSDINKE